MSIYFDHEHFAWVIDYDEKQEILARKTVYEAMAVTNEKLNNPYYNIYIYYTFKYGKLYLKLGKADKTILARYNNVTGSDAKYHMILAYHYDSNNGNADEPFHKALQEHAKNNIGFIHAPVEDLNTKEAYIIESATGLENFINIVEEVANQKCEIRKEKPLYNDIKELVNDIIFLNAKYYNLDLCYRWGKTRTTIELQQKYPERIMILTSYIGTVKTSYKEEISTNIEYENIMFIDPDEYRDKSSFEIEQMCKDWLDKSSTNKIMYYIALTGSMNENNEDMENMSCFKRRVSSLLKLKNYQSNLVVEESDFGAHCEKQGKKIQYLMRHMNCNRFIAETGTAAEKIQKIFKDKIFKVIKRDYLIHVLGSNCRPNAIGITWNVLNNSTLAAIVGKEFMENFSDMMTILPNGHFQEEWWFISFFSWYLLKDKTNIFKNLDRIKARALEIPFNSEYATIIYTCTGNKIHEALKNLLESIPGISAGFLIKIIDSTTMSNKEAERIAKDAVRDAASMGKRVIFIASGMANRSFSVPEIKNILLMMNDASFESISQKIARAFTPINNIDNLKCNIVDFRMNYQAPFLEKYLAEIGIAKINGEFDPKKLDEGEIIEILSRHNKIDFIEYDINGINPMHKLNEEELTKMMQSSRNFAGQKLNIIIEFEYNNIKEPNICNFEIKNINSIKDINQNIQGDQKRVINTKNKNLNSDNTEQETQENAAAFNKKLKHVNFLKENPYLFWNNSPIFRNKPDKIYNYVLSLNKDMRKSYEDLFELDMNTIIDILSVCHKHGFSFDVFLTNN